jgi:hypothetical protein
MYVPKRSTWTNGFFIGSDNAGYEQARGAFLGMVTWAEEYGAWYTNTWPDVSDIIAAWQGTLGGVGFGGMMGMTISRRVGTMRRGCNGSLSPRCHTLTCRRRGP